MLLHTGDELVQVECQRIPLTREERIKKGFKASGIFWLLAVCCLPIPLMHFILVPLNLALGSLKAWSFWTSEAVINDGTVESRVECIEAFLGTVLCILSSPVGENCDDAWV